MSFNRLVLADSPIINLRHEDVSGTVSNDSSGNANHGTYVGTPTLNQRSLLFLPHEGKSAVFGAGKRVTIPAGLITTTTYTYEFLIKPTSVTGAQCLAHDGTNGIYLNGDKLSLFYDAVHHDSTAAVVINEPTLLEVVVTAGAVEYFINRVSAGTAAAAPIFSATTLYSEGGGAAEIAATVCEFAAYTTAITAAKIRERYRAAFGVGFRKVISNAAPYLHAPMAETASETTGFDVSGNNIDGTYSAVTLDRINMVHQMNGGSVLFDGLAGYLVFTDTAIIQDVFDGGGAAGILLNATSDGEGNAGRLMDKASWFIAVIGESAGSAKIQFTQLFSTTNGVWETTALDLTLSADDCVIVDYDNGLTTNDPVIYINGVSVALTETSTPVGTRTTDVGSDLYVGNNAAGSATFDGRLSNVFLMPALATNKGRQINEAFKSRFAAEVISNQPVIYLRGNDPSGTVMKDYGSGGTDGTISGTPSMGNADDPLANEVSKTVIYDATDDKVDAGNVLTRTNVQPLTLMTFLKTSEAATTRIFLSKFSSSGYEFQTEIDGKVTAELINTFPSNHIKKTTSISVNDNGWHLFFAAYDGSSAAAGLVFDVDGVVDISATVGADTLSASMSSTDTFVIGQRSGDVVPFNGGIAETAGFDVILTTPKRLDIYEMSSYVAPLVGTAQLSIQNEVFAIGIATLNIENDVVAANVGTATLNIQNNLYLLGTAKLNIENQLYVVDTATLNIENQLYVVGSTQLNIQNKVFALGVAAQAIKNKVYGLDTATFNIRNIVSPGNIGTAILNVQNQLYSVGIAQLNIENRVNNPAGGVIWKAVIMLDGVDMSARFSGDINIDANEGSARIAEFSLMPFSGVIDPYEWIGVPVTIDYAQYDSAGVQQSIDRLFTGKVNEPIYNPTTRFTSFLCTDGLQEYFEQKTAAQVTAEVGGYHSETVFGKTDDKWAFAQQRMATQSASYDFDVYGVGRKTDWQAKTNPDFTFDYSAIVHESLGLSLISRRDVLNTININFSYRYGRKWQRELSGGWSYPRPFYQYLSDNTTVPNRAMVLSALSTGWDVKSIAWQKMPPTGNYINAGGSQVTWGISDELRESLVWGVGFSLSKRWLQDVTETYDIQVTADASIAKHGVIKADETYAVDIEVEEEFEEPNQTPTLSTTDRTDDSEVAGSFGYKPPEPTGTAINNYDTIDDPADRTDYETAVQTAIAESKTRILASHRDNTVVVESLLNPSLDVSKTASVTTNEVTVKGKIKNVRHRLNSDTAEAISTVEIAFYQPDVASQVDDAVAVPSQVNSTPNLSPNGLSLGSHFGGRTTTKYDPEWDGYVGNWTTNRTFPSEWYPEEFLVNIPQVEDEARDAAEFTAPVVINTAIPQDTLIINA